VIFFVSGSEASADIYKHVSEDGTILFSNTSWSTDSKIVIKEPIAPAQTKKEHSSPDSNGAPLKAGKFSDSVVTESIHAAVEEKARQHNVDPQLVKAVIKAESNWNPGAVSRKGALGLMQLMPSTAALLGVDPFNTLENIDGGVRYLKHMIDRFNGDLALALAAYNAGPKLVEKKGTVPSIPETVMYVKRVMEYYNGGQGGVFKVNSAEIQKEIRQEFNRIKKVVLEDGSLLFTNSYSSSKSF
jgi:hypothetical protein